MSEQRPEAIAARVWSAVQEVWASSPLPLGDFIQAAICDIVKAERIAFAERERELVKALKVAEKMILTCGVVFNYRLTDYIRDVIVRAESRQSRAGGAGNWTNMGTHR